jgi:hypothetical protein
MPRGRPRKYPPKEPYTGPKRARGRPRKIHAPEPVDAAAVAAHLAPPPLPADPQSLLLPVLPLPTEQPSTVVTENSCNANASLSNSSLNTTNSGGGGKRLRPGDSDTPRKMVLRIQSSPSLLSRRRLLEREANEGRVNVLYGDASHETGSLRVVSAPSLLVRQTNRALHDAKLHIADNELTALGQQEMSAEVDLEALVRYFGCRLPEFGPPTVWPPEPKLAAGRDLFKPQPIK